ncbi:hypothetical protein EUX98_g8453 [Antrodiella citrinella]|uniref:Retrotransposon gag domain-containing protein n=1 Tax=Antrodiella citrinella TaxID=2447956 RepID=A0A4S4M8S7_9APHY|nr:hypothetical protein EUX98_g8453 [Antrodiella citrinella]
MSEGSTATWKEVYLETIFHENNTEDFPNNVDELYTKITDFFKPINSVSAAIAAIGKLQQKGTAEQYVAEFQSLLALTKDNHLEMQRKWFLDGLRPWLASRVATNTIGKTKMEEYYQVAIVIDQLGKEDRGGNGSSGGSGVAHLRLQTPVQIPVKYWDVLYQKWVNPKIRKTQKASGQWENSPENANGSGGTGTNHWNALKVTWGLWKFIVEEKEWLGSEDAFWKEHSHKDGTHLTYKQINEKLRDARAAQNKADTDAALKYFYGDLFGEAARGWFTYAKGGAEQQSSKDQKIARVWRQILEEDEEARLWAALQILVNDDMDDA